MFRLLRFSLKLKIKGYNSKQIVLLKKIVERMVTLELTEDRFNVVKERVCTGTFVFCKYSVVHGFEILNLSGNLARECKWLLKANCFFRLIICRILEEYPR